MSLTFIDPLSENFAYLPPVIYCPSCAQLVFNTLPGALHSSSLSTGEHGCHGGQYFIAGPCQLRRLPEPMGRGHPPPVSFRAAWSQTYPDSGPGADRMGHGPSELLVSFFFFFLKLSSSPSKFPSSAMKRQLSGDHIHVAECQHLRVACPISGMSCMFFPLHRTASRPQSTRRWKTLSIRAPNSHLRRTVRKKASTQPGVAGQAWTLR